MMDDKEAALRKRDEFIEKFLEDDESAISLKKNQVIKLLQVSQERPLTLAEHNVLSKLRTELKTASGPEPELPLTPAPDAATLPAKSAVAKYLQDKGWKIKKSAVYNHINAGLLRPLPPGGYSTTDIDAYALSNLTRGDGRPVTVEDKESADLSLASQRARKEILEEQARMFKNKNRDFEAEWDAVKGTEIAARLALFGNELETFARSKAPDMINIVQGNLALAPDLIAFFLAAKDMIILKVMQTGDIEVSREAYQRFLDSMTATALAVSGQSAPPAATVPPPPEEV
jgi:hypothetical protein